MTRASSSNTTVVGPRVGVTQCSGHGAMGRHLVTIEHEHVRPCCNPLYWSWEKEKATLLRLRRKLATQGFVLWRLTAPRAPHLMISLPLCPHDPRRSGSPVCVDHEPTHMSVPRGTPNDPPLPRISSFFPPSYLGFA